jgi:hypothetical protein
MKCSLLFQMKIRVVAACIAGCVFSVAGSAAAQDQIPPLVISDFEGSLDEQWGGNMTGVLTREKGADYVKSGGQSGKWANMSRNKWLIKNNCPSDWSAYNQLAFWVYSKEKNFQQVNIVVDSNPEGSSGNYYIYKFNVDWTGWERVEIPLSKFTKSRNPDGWGHVTKFMLSTMSFGAVPMENTTLYLDDMVLEQK